MRTGNETNAIPDPPLDVLRGYAERLETHYSSDLRLLSTIGISVSAAHRIPLTITPGATEGNNPDRGAMGRPSPALQRPLVDNEFLTKWLADSCPLLIRAPFGCGKSVLLASFTVALAGALKRWCDKPEGPMPPVPFPVRLTRWPSSVSLDNYMRGEAQQHVDSACKAPNMLIPDDITKLQVADHLLPLFDGFDELPNPHSGQTEVRRTALDAIWGLYPKRHILTSRPGHGAEDGGYETKGRVHELAELTVEQAEEHIRVRLGIDPKATDDPRLVQYRAAQPAINDLFRRPLFLAAWCIRAEGAGARALPTSISGLMEVLLHHVFDGRIARRRGEDNGLEERVTDQSHRYGAILVFYTSGGFGRRISNRQLDDAIIKSHPLTFEGADLEPYVNDLVSAGLLIGEDHGRYTVKIPIVEYLIGNYYAWLARNHTGEEVSPHQKQLAKAFQQQFWWSDYAEVWLYAFDVMWHGTESQWTLARELTRWVLDLSKRCDAAANWDPKIPLPEGQEDSDREPFSRYNFALQVLLPIDALCIDAGEAREDLVTRAFEQLKHQYEQKWRELAGSEDALDALISRRPRLTITWLLDCVGDPTYEKASRVIAWAMGHAAAHLTAADVGVLMGYLKEPAYHEAWAAIARTIGYAAAHLSAADVGVLMGYLKEPAYHEAWDFIARAIGYAAAHLTAADVCVLMDYLKEPAYRETWAGIASAVGGAAAHLSAADLDVLMGYLREPAYREAQVAIAKAVGYAAAKSDSVDMNVLMGYLEEPAYNMAIFYAAARLTAADVGVLIGYLKEPAYRKAWATITWAVGFAKARLTAVDVGVLMSCLKEPAYCETWAGIASAVGHAAAHLTAADVGVLMGYLKEPAYHKAWAAIAKTIGYAAAHLSAADVCVLLGYLKEPAYHEARGYLAYTVGSAAAHLTAADVGVLMGYLKEPAYYGAWEAIARAVGYAAARLTAAADVGVLIGFLRNPEYEGAWNVIAQAIGRANHNNKYIPLIKRLADDAGRLGQISYISRIISAVPALIWFVRDVDPSAEIGRRIIYGVAERNDVDLLLNPKFGSEVIQRLLESPSMTALLRIATETKGQMKPTDIVIVTLQFGIGVHHSSGKMKEFEATWKEAQRNNKDSGKVDQPDARTKKTISRSTADRRLDEIMRLLLREVRGPGQATFCQRGSQKGKAAVNRPKKRPVDLPAHERPQLQVDVAALISLILGSRGAVVMEEVYQIMVHNRPPSESWADLDLPAHICRWCGKINPISSDLPAHEPPPLPPSCGICTYPFNDERVDIPQETPEEIFPCPKDEDLNFLLDPPSGTWTYGPRNLPNKCPCPQCNPKAKSRKS
ncbi:MAG TPA: hypothetical protein VGN17_28460 [Bryobacteraceae bacterium]|jgi:hypothetical protein